MPGNILYTFFFAPCNFRPLTLANSFQYTVPIQELKLLDTKSCVIIWFVEIHLMRLIRFMTKLQVLLKKKKCTKDSQLQCL